MVKTGSFYFQVTVKSHGTLMLFVKLSNINGQFIY